MDIVSFTKLILDSLLEDQSLYTVELHDEILDILIDSKDVGRVIGRGGDLASAIRKIIELKAKIIKLDNIKVSINAR